jgi:hypothetical protein
MIYWNQRLSKDWHGKRSAPTSIHESSDPSSSLLTAFLLERQEAWRRWWRSRRKDREGWVTVGVFIEES